MLLKRGVFRGLLFAGALFGAGATVEPPVIPEAPAAGGRPYAPMLADNRAEEEEFIAVLAIAMQVMFPET